VGYAGEILKPVESLEAKYWIVRHLHKTRMMDQELMQMCCIQRSQEIAMASLGCLMDQKILLDPADQVQDGCFRIQGS
jgi:hypothetical protein